MFTVAPGTDVSNVFLGVVFGTVLRRVFRSRGRPSARETENPRRDIPRGDPGTAVFGGVFFVVVTAIEMMAFGTDAQGVQAFAASQAPDG